jgi:ABC-2 type transport system ATP-binding protein
MLRVQELLAPTDDATMPAVELVNVCKAYGAVMAVDHLNLGIAQSGITAILGANGAGKSTTISMMLGILRPDAGSVRVLGQDPMQPQARQPIGAMLQTVGAPDTLRVRELIALWSSYYDAPLPASAVIDMAGLAGIDNRLFGALSGGQRRRVAFACALCGNPRILFLDEPSAGLDVEARRDFWRQVRRLAGDGRTIILSTHYLEEADALADRIVVLNRGRIIADGSAQAIKARVGGRLIRCQTVLTTDAIAAMDGVLHVTRQGRITIIAAAHVEAVVYDLLRHDHSLSDLRVSDSALEDAFMRLIA